jgi:hypothetical protein
MKIHQSENLSKLYSPLKLVTLNIKTISDTSISPRMLFTFNSTILHFSRLKVKLLFGLIRKEAERFADLNALIQVVCLF